MVGKCKKKRKRNMGKVSKFTLLKRDQFFLGKDFVETLVDFDRLFPTSVYF